MNGERTWSRSRETQHKTQKSSWIQSYNRNIFLERWFQTQHLLGDGAVFACSWAVSLPLICQSLWSLLSSSSSSSSSSSCFSSSSGRLVHSKLLWQKRHSWKTMIFSPFAYLVTLHCLLHSRHDLNSWRMHASSTINSEGLWEKRSNSGSQEQERWARSFHSVLQSGTVTGHF